MLSGSWVAASHDPDAEDAPAASRKKKRASASAAAKAEACAPVSFSECPCCTAFIETTKINEHLDKDCPGIS